MAEQALSHDLIKYEANRLWSKLLPDAPYPVGVAIAAGESSPFDYVIHVGKRSSPLSARDLLMSLDDFSDKVLMPLITGQLPAQGKVGPAMQDKVAAIIEERGGLMGTGRYGPFIDNAVIAQEMKETFRATPNWNKLNAAQREALDLIAMKISRILSGDPDYEDNWLDAEGYLRLARHNWEKDR